MTDFAARRAALAARLRAKQFTVVPGIYDMISAKLADRAGFPVLYMTGYGTVASLLGLPDAGLASYTEMVERAGRFAHGISVPLIADGDTGYGGLLNVRHTVRGYEAAGVAAIQIEDQEFPKKCGHTPGKRVVPLKEAVRRIEVAVDSRSSADFLIVARTDARAPLGLDEALRRAEAFDRAGADVIFLEAPESEAEIAATMQVTSKPVLLNLVEGGKTPILPPDRLRSLGVTIALHPTAGFLVAGEALRRGYAALAERETTLDLPVPLHDFRAFSEMIGFPDVWAFDARWAE
ncbi:isocitrate lyase/PEP mutase family protein [Elioraea sp.]|uniref:isocitrate lyase/PEP mutase family protein n=1 Tax=Elioraea sp. TaxID=2185103 RepID=UPI003F704643